MGFIARAVGRGKQGKAMKAMGNLNAFLAKQDANAALKKGKVQAGQASRQIASTRKDVLNEVASRNTGAVVGGGDELDANAELLKQEDFSIASILAGAKNTSRSFTMEAYSQRLSGLYEHQAAKYDAAGTAIAGAVSTVVKVATLGAGGGSIATLGGDFKKGLFG